MTTMHTRFHTFMAFFLAVLVGCVLGILLTIRDHGGQDPTALPASAVEIGCKPIHSNWGSNVTYREWLVGQCAPGYTARGAVERADEILIYLSRNPLPELGYMEVTND